MKRLLFSIVLAVVAGFLPLNCVFAFNPYDLNKDGSVNVTDVNILVSYILNGGIQKPETQTFTVGNVKFTMVKVEHGKFQMGSNDGLDNEKPVHQVTLTSDYWIGETEVTQGLWKAVMGSNPSNFTGDDLPVEMVSWDDCQTFITKLNQKTGKTFRLPTEAEWEFAARGGNKSFGFEYSGDNNIYAVAWFFENGDKCTHPVKTKDPNELGIYDMTGNVDEWCQDRYGNYSSSAQTNPKGPSSGDYRVVRGGSYGNSASWSRVSCRLPVPEGYDYTFSTTGFRIAR